MARYGRPFTDVLALERVNPIGEVVQLLYCNDIPFPEIVSLEESSHPGSFAKEIPGTPISSVLGNVCFYWLRKPLYYKP
jgi:hypothetical protein